MLVSASIRDISDRKKLQEELRHKNEELQKQNARVEAASLAKSRFLANMSHELRTPLNSIIGFTEIIHDGRAGAVNSDPTEYLGDVLSSARQLQQLINDILDLSKVEAGKIKLSFCPQWTRLLSLEQDRQHAEAPGRGGAASRSRWRRA